MLLGKDGTDKIRAAKVLVCGLGGVGGHVLEELARLGVGTLGVLDDDVIKPSNLNRQILATLNTVGVKKTAAAKDRVLSISPECNVVTYDFFYSAETADNVDLSSYDFVVDAIDTVSSKLELIARAKAANVKIVSSMGTGNKLKPCFVQTDIKKTTVCPLARVMRKELKARDIDSLAVVYSDETPKEVETVTEHGRHIPASVSYVPAAAAAVIVGYVLEQLLDR